MDDKRNWMTDDEWESWLLGSPNDIVLPDGIIIPGDHELHNDDEEGLD